MQGLAVSGEDETLGLQVLVLQQCRLASQAAEDVSGELLQAGSIPKHDVVAFVSITLVAERRLQLPGTGVGGVSLVLGRTWALQSRVP